MKRNFLTNLLHFFFFAIFIFSVSSLRAQGFNITETFKDEVITSVTLGGDPSAYLTSGIDDPSGEGWLRLTKDDTYKKGFAILNQSFPSGLGVLIDLEFKTWRSDASHYGADGFSVFLFDPTVIPFNLGAFGGSLGYAQYDGKGGSFPGLSGGYFGLGVDEFGNYSNTNEGRIGGLGFMPNTIGVRGPASTNYAWLTGKTIAYTDFSLQYGVSYSRPSDDAYYRRFQIEITPSTSLPVKYSITFRAKIHQTGAFMTVFGPYELPSLPPALLKLGFAASTGDGVNYHEVRNLYITTPGGIRITKQVDKIVAKVGDELTYTIDLYNQVDKAVSGLIFTDPLSQLLPGFLIESVSFDNDGNIGNTATGYSKTNLSNVTVSLDASSRASFVIKGKIKTFPPGGVITNTAIFKVGLSEVIDQDATNDTATVSTNVMVPDYLISQTLDDACLDTVNGSNLILTVKNIGNTSGAIGSSVIVKDTIPSGLKGVVVPDQGWTISKSGNIYTFTRSDALSAGENYPDILITIKPDGTTTNSEWINRAYVSNYFDIDSTNNAGSPFVLKALPLAYAGADQTSYNSGLFTLAANNPNTSSGTWSVISGNASVSEINNYNTTVYLSPDSIATLRWTISNGSCTTYDDVVLTYVEVTSDFFIPNVYTPNGDGINDYFEIVGLSAFSNANLTVFNRWGNEVYYNPDYNNNWDGDGLNGGTYYYLLILKKEGKKDRFHGWVLLKK